MKKIALVAFCATFLIVYIFINYRPIFNALIGCSIPLLIIAVLHAKRIDIYSKKKLGIFNPMKANSLVVIFSLFVPSRISELLKPWYYNKKNGLLLSEGVSIVLVEHIYDLIALLLMAIVFFSYNDLKSVNNSWWFYTTILLLFLTIFILFIILWKDNHIIERIIQFIPIESVENLIRNGLNTFRTSLNEGLLFLPLFLTFLVWLSSWGVYWLFFHIYSDHAISLLQALVIFFIASIGLSFSITPGGLGTFEGGIIAILYFYGFSTQEALPASIGLRLLSLIPSVFIAPLVLFFEAKQLGDINLRILKND